MDVVELAPSAPSPVLFTSAEILHRIKQLKTGKAPGADGITAQLLKNCGEELAACLTTLLNGCLLASLYQTHWKTANTVILKKPGKPDYHNPTAYRPKALLSTMSKVLKGAITARMQEYA